MSFILTYCTNLKESTDENVSMGGQSFGTDLIKRDQHCFSKTRGFIVQYLKYFVIVEEIQKYECLVLIVLIKSVLELV